MRTFPLRRRLAWAAMAALVCAYICVRYQWENGPFFNLRQYAAGNAMMPYQGRVLMAWLLRVTAGNAHFGPLLTALAHRLPPQLHDPYTVMLLLVDVVCLLVALAATVGTLRVLTGDAEFSAWAAFLVAYMAFFNLTFYGLSYTLPYDIPSLTLFSVCLYLFLSGYYWWLLPAFCVCTLNRETSMLFLVFCAMVVWFRHRQGERVPRAAIVSMAMQAIAWVTIRAAVHHHFRLNARDRGGSGVFLVQVMPNLHSLLKPQQWPLLASVCGFLLPLVWLRATRHEPLRRATQWLIGIWAVAVLLVGTIVEIRIFNELAVFAAPVVAMIAFDRWFGPRRVVQAPVAGR